MFIKNYKSVSSIATVWVDHDIKKYLETLGYIALSEHDDKWAFIKSDDLLNIINSWKGGKKWIRN